MTDLEPAFDLIPRTCEVSNIRTLVSDTSWKGIGRQVRDEARCCELCGRVGRRVNGVRSTGDLHAHELWRYSDNDRVQLLDRIQCLCPDCHQAVHWSMPWPGYQDRELNKYRLGPYLATVEMIEAAGWCGDQIEEHQAETLHRHARRSEIADWTLDLTRATPYGVDLGVLDSVERRILHPKCRAMQDVRASARRFGIRQSLDGWSSVDYDFKAAYRTVWRSNVQGEVFAMTTPV